MPHPEQFVPDTLENIADYLRTGVCIGAWQQGRLGYSILLSAQIFPEECDNIFWFVQIKDRKGSLCMIWKISKYSDQIFFVR